MYTRSESKIGRPAGSKRRKSTVKKWVVFLQYYPHFFTVDLSAAFNPAERPIFDSLRVYKILTSAIFCLCTSCILHAESFTLINRGDAGMFSMFTDVMAALDLYEKKHLQGLIVDFGEEGLYYDSKIGSNWWSYYFEPISVGETKQMRRAVFEGLPRSGDRKFWKSRKEANTLIQKYIRIRPEILEKIETFKQNYFTGHFMIGVHYRGTDQDKPGPYNLYLEQTQKTIDALDSGIDYRIFVASDEQSFIDAVVERFADRVCFQNEALRSRDRFPLHQNPLIDRYRQGKEGLIDCVLLSQCDFFLASFSNLSVCAFLLNPDLPVVDVSARHLHFLVE